MKLISATQWTVTLISYHRFQLNLGEQRTWGDKIDEELRNSCRLLESLSPAASCAKLYVIMALIGKFALLGATFLLLGIGKAQGKYLSKITTNQFLKIKSIDSSHSSTAVFVESDFEFHEARSSTSREIEVDRFSNVCFSYPRSSSFAEGCCYWPDMHLQ